MKTYGLDSSDFEILQSLVLEPLKADGYKVYLFGSRARGKHHPFSDVDLLIESNHSNRDLINKIKEQIEEARFPVKVEIVDSRELVQSYKDSVLKERIEL